MKQSWVHMAGMILLGGLLVGCAGTRRGESPCPSWFEKVPEDPEFVYAPATATSKDLQLAINKAKTEGRTELASQLEVRMQGLRKKFDEEVGLGADAELNALYSQAVKEVISQVLVGSRVSEQTTMQEEGIWRACVLMELPIGAANGALAARIKANQAMYTRFRASQAFGEMEKEVDKYEAWKKEQGMP